MPYTEKQLLRLFEISQKVLNGEITKQVASKAFDENKPIGTFKEIPVYADTSLSNTAGTGRR